MNDAIAPLSDLFGRIPELTRHAADGLDTLLLTASPAPGANPIGWLLWHVGRVQDAQIADLTGQPQIWVESDWPDRFGLDADPANHGYGHGPEEVAAVRPDGSEAVIGYVEAAVDRAIGYLQRLGPEDLEEIIDRSYDPPVTLGVRLCSIVDDCLQHLGQAAYARGILERTTS